MRDLTLWDVVLARTGFGLHQRGSDASWRCPRATWRGRARGGAHHCSDSDPRDLPVSGKRSEGNGSRILNSVLIVDLVCDVVVAVADESGRCNANPIRVVVQLLPSQRRATDILSD